MAAYSNLIFGLRELKLKKGKFYSILDEEFGGLSPADGSWYAKKVSHPCEKPERRKKYM